MPGCRRKGLLLMAAEISLGPAPARWDALGRRIRFLVAGTIAYNVIEAIVAITAGSNASSSALMGFGLDSVIEVSSAAAVAWRFSAREHHVREAREKRHCGSSRCRSSPWPPSYRWTRADPWSAAGKPSRH
ncbi:hypothetical protein GCM10023323_67900 [Streptomyces thinghirensis]|uniref:Cation transporter n=1 Tax=Streptomyces thinghirensis TaxID=551547 RepID=A0ABP9TFG6_9ACTN